MPHPTPPTPPGWGWGGDGGLRGWGGALGGWGIRRISCITLYTHIHTCWYQNVGKEQNRKCLYSISYSTIFNNSSGNITQNSGRSRLDRSQTDISDLFSPNYANPIINRTVPYVYTSIHLRLQAAFLTKLRPLRVRMECRTSQTICKWTLELAARRNSALRTPSSLRKGWIRLLA
jgi:hypothetical protein